MKLHEYLSQPDSLSVAQLRERVGAQSDAQIRQWQHGYAERKPSFDNSVAIEKATDGQVTVEELRPDGPWLRVKDKAWPHPKGRPVLDFAHAEPKAEQGA
jgi:Putative antitoxin of bacterial toxin-antitoxin system, YdaS/YdaT